MNNRVVTIWATYGPYHFARIQALINIGFELVPLSHALSDNNNYPFFKKDNYEINAISQCDVEDIIPILSFYRTFNLLGKYRPSLILTCGYERPETFASVIFSKIYDCKVFVFVDNQLNDKQRNPAIEFFKKYYMRLFDGIVCGGSTHIDYLTYLGYSTERIATGYDCVDSDRILAYATQVRTQNLKPLSPYAQYFLCIARLIPKKNLFKLIRAYDLYKRNVSLELEPWKLVLCGNGPLYQQLLDELVALGLSDHVCLAGQVDDFEDVINYYSYAKAFILPSIENEQWGLVVNEAISAGLPVIVSKQCGCSSDLVQDEVNGFTFDGNSAQELSEHMLWMHINQEKLTQMGKASEAIISKFSTSVFASNVKILYERVS